MLNFLHEIPTFIWIVLSSWQGWITGGVLVALCTVWERWREKTIPWKKYKWGVIVFLLISVYSAWYDQRSNARRLEYDRHNLNRATPAFQNGIGVLKAFMAYRQSIGPDAACWLLISSTDDTMDLANTFVALAVPGSSCPNGDLQNIGVKPWEVEKESLIGTVPGKLVVHALPETKGVDRLVDDLSNLIPTIRVFEMPRPVKVSSNIIWLQFGPGAKWKTQR